ncbi:50S ribosome-binding GTPase [Phytophthora infestans]|uniref:50S ribosome-binding GTPase n=1 Tax=Phytophthora infestans TaxID=4787 RepID=A0A833SRC8_PHYIN|nr:50S ribosome-binding GTPase [Phytophthora infestans]KAF4146960.1 50S ribosome-binding GTPase [Phytophthora infestans]
MQLEKAERLEEKITKLALRLDSANLSDQDIDRGLELIKEVQAFLEQTDYGNCIAVLGATGAGKSTVVSMLFGNSKLLVHHEDEYTRVLIAEKPLPGINIQYGSLSKTLLPAVLSASVNGQSMMIVDMPGTHDTRGPFAELVAHFILNWLLANHKNVQFIIVATPPQERSQEVRLAGSVNRACVSGSNTVLVFTKCDADFDPRIATKMKAIYPEYRDIPVFALPRPRKLDKEGLDYSSPLAEMKLNVLRALASPAKQASAFAEPIPDTAQLLLRTFCKRNIELARDALSQVLGSQYSPQQSRYTISTISELLAILESHDPLTFETFVGQIERFVPRSSSISGDSTVLRAIERLKFMEMWSESPLMRCKGEWLSAKCLGKLEQIKRNLNSLNLNVHKYQNLERKRRENTIVVSGYCLRLTSSSRLYSTIEDFVKATNSTTEAIPTVVLIGFKAITITAELRVWANVVIISPEVCMAKIDLSAEGQAPPPVQFYAIPGQSGVHGVPGRSGGILTIICNELVNPQFIHLSAGQQGGDGQNGSDSINEFDLESERQRFRTDVGSALNSLTSLKEWESVSKYPYLPFGLYVSKWSKREMPPDTGHMALTAVGSAITASGVAVSACLPLLAPIVAPTMLPVGTGMIRKGIQRNTQVTLELERSIKKGKAAGRPGRGGYGGCGGECYVVKGGHEVRTRRGASGEQGENGLPGKSLQTLLLKGTVTQEYGIFGCRQGEPTVDIAAVLMNDATCTNVPRSGFSPEQQQSTMRNSLLRRSVVEGYYEEAFAELKKTFSQCDFPDVEMP